MLDVLKQDIRRGDTLIDKWGHRFSVSGVTPTGIHIQDTVTGKRFRYTARAISRDIPTFMRIPLTEPLTTAKDRQRYFRERAPRA